MSIGGQAEFTVGPATRAAGAESSMRACKLGAEQDGTRRTVPRRPAPRQRLWLDDEERAEVALEAEVLWLDELAAEEEEPTAEGAAAALCGPRAEDLLRFALGLSAATGQPNSVGAAADF